MGQACEVWDEEILIWDLEGRDAEIAWAEGEICGALDDEVWETGSVVGLETIEEQERTGLVIEETGKFILKNA